MLLARFAFQAGAIDHSSISPLLNLALTGTRSELERKLCPNPVDISAHLATNQAARHFSTELRRCTPMYKVLADARLERCHHDNVLLKRTIRCSRRW